MAITFPMSTIAAWQIIALFIHQCLGPIQGWKHGEICIMLLSLAVQYILVMQPSGAYFLALKKMDQQPPSTSFLMVPGTLTA